MEKIIVNVSWCDKNYGAALSDNVPGAVVVTAKSYDELIEEVKATLQFHVEGMIADGDDVPQWLRDGDYEFEYHSTDHFLNSDPLYLVKKDGNHLFIVNLHIFSNFIVRTNCKDKKNPAHFLEQAGTIFH